MGIIDDSDGDEEKLAEDFPGTEFSAVSRLLAMRNRKDKSDRESTPDFGGFWVYQNLQIFISYSCRVVLSGGKLVSHVHLTSALAEEFFSC